MFLQTSGSFVCHPKCSCSKEKIQSSLRIHFNPTGDAPCLYVGISSPTHSQSCVLRAHRSPRMKQEADGRQQTAGETHPQHPSTTHTHTHGAEKDLQSRSPNHSTPICVLRIVGIVFSGYRITTLKSLNIITHRNGVVPHVLNHQ